MQEYRMLIGGEWVGAETGDWIESVNPFDGKAWARIPRAGPGDVRRAASEARRAFLDPSWSRLTASARGHLLMKLADLIAEHSDQLARLETTDNGKLINEMSSQLRYLPQWFRYFGGLADKIQGSVIPIDKPGVFNFTRHEPLGVIAAITPWNSPLLLAGWKLAPALAAGNTVVWKPSEFSSVSALAFARLFELVGFPRGVVNVVTGYGSEIGEALVSDPAIAKVAFTGGDQTGQRVYQTAASGIKPVTLELGGKSANIVFDDADLDNAIKGVVSGIFAASGQTCIAGSRALVQRSIYREFTRRLIEFAATAKIGNPLDTSTQVGPVTTRPQYDKVLSYIQIAKDEGAKCLLGGQTPQRPDLEDGWFVEPTIFGDVRPDMRIAQEEVFGPVLAVIAFEDEDDAIRIANDTIYGLAAGVWTKSMRRALLASEKLEAGTVWVNTYRAVSYMSPFGGYKRSGIGRESGIEAINEYLQTKSVWIDVNEPVPDPFVMR
ncbi:carnitine dehydratase [Bradyrhizobium sp. NAS80.1]|uniref:aldehyde dehydrogenase n=1 Tax=Bradyrhizobium sp. NAS80.1 TaxID=1680159 RepID=UPI0009590041|nr:aldehyde dehydrogenase [Bradyrhizobium sp. NAS80.1]OKO78035.1 carnitine dehydratase [Bradyrhizobium sp. NAS80.1]